MWNQATATWMSKERYRTEVETGNAEIEPLTLRCNLSGAQVRELELWPEGKVGLAVLY